MIGPEEGNIMTMVKIGRESIDHAPSDGAAGILIGAGSTMEYRSASLIYHSWGEDAGLFIGIDDKGKVFVRDLEKENEYAAYAEKGRDDWQETILRITAERGENGMAQLRVIAVNPLSRQILSEITGLNIESDRLTGNIALVSHHEREDRNSSLFSFSQWRVRGSRIHSHREHNTGPIVTAQYTLSRGTLKMTAQLMPVTKEICDSVELQFTDEGRWQTVARAAVDTPSYTASFRLRDFNDSDDRSFRLVADYIFGKGPVNTLSGIIRHDPADKDEIKLVTLSCIEHVIKPDPTRQEGIDSGYFPFEWGVLFPHTRMTGNIKKQKPDLLFFAGGQVYESASATAAVPVGNAIEDYLYKWYLWCLTYRDLTTTIPSVTIPDEHDVYQEKLWGCGGIATPPGLQGSAARDAGGYQMPARFINTVQKTQTSHLPDPVDPQPAGQGIGVCFTECNVGGVSLAVIEDAAEAIGQTCDGPVCQGRPCGGLGTISCLSFYPNKHVTTGEGGMILTDDDELAERCRSLRNLCFQKRRFIHEELGWNFRMSNLQAAVGVAQLERLDGFLVRKRAIGALYDRLLAGTIGLQLPLGRTPDADNLYWVYGVVLDDAVPFDADEAMRRMAKAGVGTRPFFWPLHEQPVLRRMGFFAHDRHPVAERIARRGFYLPSGLAATDAQLEASAERLKRMLETA